MNYSGLTYTLNYTIAGSAGTVSFNPSASTGLFLDPDGMRFVPSARAYMVDRPRADGSHIERTYKTGLVGEIRGKIVANTLANRQTQIEALETAVDALHDHEVNGWGSLVWTPTTGSARELSYLKAIDELDLITFRGVAKGFRIALASREPYAKLDTLDTGTTSALTSSGSGFDVPLTIPVTLVGSGGGTVSCNNTGNVVSYPTIQINGPIDDPVLYNQTTGKRLSFANNGSIASGDYWTVDMLRHTAYLNGSEVSAASQLGAIELSTSEWWGLVPGSQTVQLSGANYSASTSAVVSGLSAFGV